MTIIEILNQYGFATLAAIAMGWFIYFIYKFTTENIKQKLSEARNNKIYSSTDTGQRDRARRHKTGTSSGVSSRAPRKQRAKPDKEISKRASQASSQDEQEMEKKRSR